MTTTSTTMAQPPSAQPPPTILGADTTDGGQFHIDYDPTDPRIIAASRPSPDPEHPITPWTRLLGFTSGLGSRLVASVVMAILGVLAGIVPYVALGRILGRAIANGLDGASLAMWLIVAAVAQLVSRGLLMASTMLSHRVAYRTLYRVRVGLTQKLGRVPLGRVVDTPSGRLKKVFVEDIQACELPLAHLLPEFTAHIAGPLAVIIYLFVLDWRLALAALLPLVLGVLTMTGMFYKYSERFARFNATNQAMNATVVQYVRGIAVIKAFNQSSSSFGKYLHDVRAFRDATVAWFRSTQVWAVLAWTVIPAGLVVMVPWGAHLVASGQASLDTVLLACVLSLALAPSLISLVGYTDSLSIVMTSLKDAMAWFEEQEMLRPQDQAALDGSGFTLQEVGFNYHNDDAPALAQLSMDAPAGGFTALVGPSGAGKSTVGRLLAGFWEPTDGVITLGGVDLKQVPLGQLMENIAYVTQDNYLFDATIAENLRLANPEATEAELEAVLAAAGCADFMARLPQGMHTRVGGAGTHLSGGERQRLTIARALLKDSPVVILDEATSYVDPAGEFAIQQAISRLTAGKTLIVVAHRLSTVTQADQLVVLEHGRLVQKGRHAELATGEGIYAQLWETHQAARAAAGDSSSSHVGSDPGVGVDPTTTTRDF